ncbi:MAG: CRISPR-associated endonuclease Cas2 [Elusimicrobiota bacterium]|nr:CRISPR-associated endonuclease Cas2 [Elusimicrobiota bacterium]
MRIIVFFDLPTETAENRRDAARFRNDLIKDGYYMLQYSVYCRICRGLDSLDKHIRRLMSRVPPEGNVRALEVTEKQYGRMKIILGKKQIVEEIDDRQLLLF